MGPPPRSPAAEANDCFMVQVPPVWTESNTRWVAPVPVQTGENWWFPRGMANAVAAQASDLAMIDIMKIGGVTGWLNAMGQAEAASLPLSSHTFNKPSAHVLAITPTAHWLEYLDIAGAVLTERL